ncbi:MAG: CHRD domain-containing protein [Planctomycetales bacterium]|nr:CHRD domain-containing protein [Planctomycetales bacterium]
MRLHLVVLVLGLSAMNQLALGHELRYETTLSGLNENPPNASAGSGTASVTIDLDLATMRVQADFSGLTGTVSAAHIHCCTAAPNNVGVATPTPTFPGFPSGVQAGSYDMTFDLADMASYNAGFVSNNGGTVSSAMNTLITGLDNGEAYLNIHTSAVGAGEIRGFFQPVPEPASGLLLITSLLGVAYARRRQIV